MSAHTLAEFHELYKLEPWGFEQQDYHAARIAQSFANNLRPLEPRPLSEFLTSWENPDDNDD